MNVYPWLYDYLAGKPGAHSDFKAEWQWTRYMIDGKMFAAICRGDSGEDELITLKLEPTEGELLRQTFRGVFPGYYSDKRHWNSICLSPEALEKWRPGGEHAGEAMPPDGMLRDLCDKSHSLILAKLSKRRQAEILASHSPNSHI